MELDVDQMVQEFIFISYSKQDIYHARRVAQYLTSHGFTIWMFDPSKCPRMWWLEITKAIAHCGAFVMISTYESLTSRWVKREVYLAQELSKPIFIVSSDFSQFDLLEDVPKAEKIIQNLFGLDQLILDLSRYSFRSANVGSNYIGKSLPDIGNVFKILKIDYDSGSLAATKLKTNSPHRIKNILLQNQIISPLKTSDIDWIYIKAGVVNIRYPHGFGTHNVKSFFISKFPVTIGLYSSFVSHGGYSNAQYWTIQGWNWKGKRLSPFLDGELEEYSDCHPITGISWYEAVAFCNWMNKSIHKMGVKVSLPTEAQIQLVTQPNYNDIFPWGHSFDTKRCNVRESKLHKPSVVNTYPIGRSSTGVYDLAGNIWEWCLNKWESPLDTSLEGKARRVVKGGSWFDPLLMSRNIVRSRDEPEYRANDLGMRLVLNYEN